MRLTHLLTAAAVSITIVAAPAVAGGYGTPAAKANTIVDVAAGAGSFTTLVAALKAAGLDTALQAPGPFTVFAPTDDAFKKLPAGTVEGLLKDIPKLKAILLNHVVSGEVKAAQVINLKSAKTLGGGELAIKVEGSTVKVGAATVTTADVMASNGVIHVIDTVLIPVI